MVESFLIFCILFLSVIGLCEIIYLIRKFATYPGVKTVSYAVIYLESGHALKQLKFLCQKIRWQGVEFANSIIAVTDYLDNKEIDLCTNFALENNVILCDTNLLKECFLFLQGEFLDGNRQ